MPTLGLNGDTVNTAPYTVAACVTGTGGGPYEAPSVSATQSFVTIQGTSILIETNIVPTHVHYANNCSTIDTHSAGGLDAGQDFVTINGVPIVMNGDPSVCDDDEAHTLTASGPAWVTISP